MMKTLSELRTNIGSTVSETQVNSLIDSFINLTIAEIHSFHEWTWRRRKTTFATVVSQEDYNLDEEVDGVALLRQLTSPNKLIYLPDPKFYKYVPNPENLGTGNPEFYRLWEETGFSTQNAVAEKITAVSSSTADTSSFTVVVVGRESTNNLEVSEILTLNGTTAVTSSYTYAIGGLFQCSKSAQTTGTITLKGATSSTTLSTIAPEESAPRFKRLSLYPIPSAVITMYLEYFTRPRLLVNDADVPQMDHKWIWVLREGVLAKMWEYKQNETASTQHFQIFRNGLELMRREDLRMTDYVPCLERPFYRRSTVRRMSDSSSNNFPSYALDY